MFKLNHINLVVSDPASAAAFYQRHILPDGDIVQLGNSLHLRNRSGSDMAFQPGKHAAELQGEHHGFLAGSADAIDALKDRLQSEGVEISDDCKEDGFRSIKFIDPFGYECEVYWDADWP